MNNTFAGVYWIAILVISAIIAIFNFIKSVRIELDVRKGVDAKAAAKYHRRFFHRKRDKALYESEVSACHK